MRLPNLLCVGSGLTPRYRLNTLQALALPLGSRIQFRYVAKLIPDGLQKKLAEETFRANVLLGYVDCNATGRREDNRCTILPYRYAQLVGSRQVGDVFILHLGLSDFAISSDLEKFQRSLTGDLPHWKGDKLEGSWCLELPGEFDATKRTNSIADWQNIVKHLREHADYSNEPYFCTTEGLFKRGGHGNVAMKNGEYTLRSDQDYELRIFHFDPSADAHTGHKSTRWLKFEATAPWLQFQSTPLLAIDSPYDLKSVYFRSGSTIRPQYSLLVAKDREKVVGLDKSQQKSAECPGQDEEEEPKQFLELHLPVKIKGGIWKTGSFGFLLGALLAAQQLLVLYSRPTEPPVPNTVAAIILGFVTGFLVAFGVRKPV